MLKQNDQMIWSFVSYHKNTDLYHLVHTCQDSADVYEVAMRKDELLQLYNLIDEVLSCPEKYQWG